MNWCKIAQAPQVATAKFGHKRNQFQSEVNYPWGRVGTCLGAQNSRKTLGPHPTIVPNERRWMNLSEGSSAGPNQRSDNGRMLRKSGLWGAGHTFSHFCLLCKGWSVSQKQCLWAGVNSCHGFHSSSLHARSALERASGGSWGSKRLGGLGKSVLILQLLLNLLSEEAARFTSASSLDAVMEELVGKLTKVG